MTTSANLIDLQSVGENIKQRLDNLDAKFDSDGNAYVASKAVKDSSDNVITETYIRKQDIVDICNEVIAEG